MNKRFISTILFICFFSCKKDDESNNNYYIKANINGTAVNFHKQAKASVSHGDLTGSITMSAAAETNAIGSSNLILKFANNNTEIKTGTYVQTANNGLHFITSTYNPGGDAVYFVYDAGSNPKAAPPFTLTISQITSSMVSGSFSGAYYHNLPSDSLHFTDSVLITNGEFRLPVK